ncbi:major facilitator superfamily domain-containing protein [Rhypophila decipiens]|uniref:Major facilitator superfamily domain-containing protein n=1 Tax=Rhypophila decipiens TaxID=261697 RepID=A0AAN7B1D0_9PEZI|nr:major facilitator superfamily domain-containing protein [Rhypophila decipiens]
MARGDENPPARRSSDKFDDAMSQPHIFSEASSSTLDLEKQIARRDHEDDKKQLEDDHSTTDTGTGSDNENDDNITSRSQPNNIETAKPLTRIISRVLSHTSHITHKSTGPPPPPPDGGLPAWTAVACSHLIIMNTWGFINSWAMFQSHYLNSSPALAPHNTQSAIAWIGSIQIFLLFFIGTLTGRLTDAGYFKEIYTLGAIFQIVGIFTTSVAFEAGYWQLFLAQGVCVGIGNGCLFCPTMANVSTYFQKKRALAIAIVASGSGTGGLIYPSMMRQLVPKVGFAWAVRAMGFIVLFNLVVGGLFMKRREGLGKGRGIKGWGDIVDWAAWKEPEYTFYAAGTWFIFLGLYFGLYYLSTFSRDVIGLSFEDSLNLLLVCNGLGIPARLIANHAADKVGILNMFIPAGILAGATVLAWMGVNSVTGMYVWAAAYGAGAGALQSLFPAGLTTLTTDIRKTGVRMGMIFTLNSFATLIGPPIAGAIISASGGSYLGAQGFAGASMVLGTVLLVGARFVKGRKIAQQAGGEKSWIAVKSSRLSRMSLVKVEAPGDASLPRSPAHETTRTLPDGTIEILDDESAEDNKRHNYFDNPIFALLRPTLKESWH